MKKLITTCAMLMAVTMVSFAQAKTVKTTSATTTKTSATPEQLAERQAKALQSQLGLSAEQYNNVYIAELDVQKQLKAGGADLGEGPKAQMKITRDQRLQNTMTPDQWSKYQALNPSAKH